jgi:hypothetical protein
MLGFGITVGTPRQSGRQSEGLLTAGDPDELNEVL